MRYLVFVFAFFLALVVVAAGLAHSLPFASQPRFAVAFSAAQVRYLELEPSEVWQAILTELKPSHVRLQANWNEVESEPGQYDFTELDSLVTAAQAAGATVTMAVGRKLPRWPECHDPTWLKGLSSEQAEDATMAMVRTTVEHYRSNPAVVRWQVENEPLFAYGACVTPNWHRLQREVALLKQLDLTRPVLLTDSGELGSWWETARLADEQGTTLYRVTWNPVFRYFTYPWPPYYYRLKAALVAPFVKRTIVSELQMEPWGPAGLKALTLAEAQRSLSVKRLRANADFFGRTGLSEAFVWGVEWWYYVKVHTGDSSYWDAGRELFKPVPSSVGN